MNLKEKYKQYQLLGSEIKIMLIDKIKQHITEKNITKYLLKDFNDKIDLANYSGNIYEESDIAQALIVIGDRVCVECECGIYDLEDDLSLSEVEAFFTLIGLTF